MMVFFGDWYRETFAGNETTRRIFVNGMVTQAVEMFENRIKQDADPTLSDFNILKFFFYSDHDDSTIAMSTAFDYTLSTYPDFASQIIFELWKNATDSSYYVKMRINDQNITLRYACGDQESCSFDNFRLLAKKVSFYGDSAGYEKLCNRPPKPISPEVMYKQREQLLKSKLTSTEKVTSSAHISVGMQVLICYIALLSLAGIVSYVIYLKNKKQPEQAKLITSAAGPSEAPKEEVVKDSYQP